MTAMTIHVCGEALVDLVPVAPGSLNDHTPSLGGGPFNVAIAAARLGGDVSFQSRISTDGFGRELFAALEREGIDTTWVQRGDEPTTLAVATIYPDGSASYTFYFEGTSDRLVQPRLAPADIACFGTISLALEPGASRYANLLKEFARQGTLVALDPNIRPFYATDSHRAFLRELLPYVTLLKLSADEVDFLGPIAIKQVPIVVITDGGSGLRVLAGTTVFQLPAYPVQVADTIGAGDAVMAALLTIIDERGLDRESLERLSQYDWQKILDFAAKAAALTVSRTGAQSPTRAEVEAFGA